MESTVNRANSQMGIGAKTNDLNLNTIFLCGEFKGGKIGSEELDQRSCHWSNWDIGTTKVKVLEFEWLV